MWTYLVCRQIVIDIGVVSKYSISDIPGHLFLHRFLHEEQKNNRSVCLTLNIVDLPRYGYKHHLNVPTCSLFLTPC